MENHSYFDDLKCVKEIVTASDSLYQKDEMLVEATILLKEYLKEYEESLYWETVDTVGFNTIYEKITNMYITVENKISAYYESYDAIKRFRQSSKSMWFTMKSIPKLNLISLPISSGDIELVERLYNESSKIGFKLTNEERAKLLRLNVLLVEHSNGL